MLMIQAAAIALIALILTPGWFFYFDVTPKLVVLLVAAGVALVPLRRSRLTALVMLTLASLALSTALSPNPALSFYGTHWRQYGALAQAAVLIFAWALSAQDTRAYGILLRTVSVGRRTHRAVRNRAVSGLGPDSARRRAITSAKASGPSCARLRRSATSATSPPGCSSSSS